MTILGSLVAVARHIVVFVRRVPSPTPSLLAGLAGICHMQHFLAAIAVSFGGDSLYDFLCCSYSYFGLAVRDEDSLNVGWRICCGTKSVLHVLY